MPEIYTPTSFSLSGRELARLSPRPSHVRQEGYDRAFDSTTVFYDARVIDGTLRLVCPPLENLFDEMRVSVESKGTRVKRKRRDRSETLSVDLPRLAETISVSVGSESIDLDVRAISGRIGNHRGMRVLQTLSLNNPLEWIEEWATYYVLRHGTEAITLYDNGSSAYSLGELSEVLAGVQGLQSAVIVKWPFPYGPGGGAAGVWDSDYCQHGTFEHSRLVINGNARSLVNADIDELILAPAKLSAHRLAELSPTGGVIIPGRWIEDARDELVGLPHYVHYDKMNLKRKDSISPPKWAISPSRIPFPIQLRTHSVRNWPLLRIPGLEYRHYRGLSVRWRESADGWNYRRNAVDVANLRVDNRLRGVMMGVSWPKRW